MIKTNSTRSNAGTHGSEFVTLRFNQRVPRKCRALNKLNKHMTMEEKQ